MTDRVKTKTFIERQISYNYADRQNTVWSKEIARKCKHNWQPVSFTFEAETAPDLSNGRVYCVCMKCFSHSYVNTGWIGYYLGDPDILEDDYLRKNYNVSNEKEEIAIIIDRIKQEGIKLRLLAKETNLSTATLSRFINGKTPSYETYMTLRKWYFKKYYNVK